jgi:hypothetical protein
LLLLGLVNVEEDGEANLSDNSGAADEYYYRQGDLSIKMLTALSYQIGVARYTIST